MTRVSKRSPRAPLPSVAQVLQFDSLVAADPVVVAGAVGLSQPVRWVHISEITDIAGLLRGHEMVLTTGIALPDAPGALASYIEELALAEVSALVVGLGPRFELSLPLEMLQAADDRGMPVVVLRRHTAFVSITEDVHTRLAESQLHELQLSEQIHETLSAMLAHGSSANEILAEVSRLSDRPVVLESLSHELFEVSPGRRTKQDVVSEWSEHAKRHRSMRRTDFDPRTGWLVATVGIRGDDWGRLILMSAADETFPRGVDQDPLSSVRKTLVALLERSAATLALGRIVERDRGIVHETTHLDIIEDLLRGGSSAEQGVEVAEAMGLPVRTAVLVALHISVQVGATGAAAEQFDLLHRASAAVRSYFSQHNIPFLCARERPGTVLLLVMCDAQTDSSSIAAIATSVLAARGTEQVLVAWAGPDRGAPGATRVLNEAVETAQHARTLELHESPVQRQNLGLEGLLLAVSEGDRLPQYVEDMLGTLRRYEAEHRVDLITPLRNYLFAGRNKSLAAKRSFVSRPWIYEQLERVESVLGASLDDEDTCLRLQVAVLAHDLLTKVSGQTAPGPGTPTRHHAAHEQNTR